MESISAKRPRKSEAAPLANPVDVYVGNRVRLLRLSLGISAVQLAKRIETSFQQIGKYESGSDRLTASQIYSIAVALGVSVEFFFEELYPDEFDGEALSDHDRLVDFGVMHPVEAMRLILHYQKIVSPERRQAALQLVRSLACEADQVQEASDECH